MMVCGRCCTLVFDHGTADAVHSSMLYTRRCDIRPPSQVLQNMGIRIGDCLATKGLPDKSTSSGLCCQKSLMGHAKAWRSSKPWQYIEEKQVVVKSVSQ